MRRIKVNAYETALVFKDGQLERVLGMGKYWILPNSHVEKFYQKGIFDTEYDIHLLLENEDLASLLDVIDVRDNEVILRYENGNFIEVLTSGTYAYWNAIASNDFKVIDLNEVEVNPSIERKVLDSVKVARYVAKFTVENYERGILNIDGKFERILEPGTYYFVKAIKRVQVDKIDMRKRVMDINGQEILTKDKATIRINVLAQYKITDIYKAMIEVSNYSGQMYAIIQLAYRSYISKLTLDEFLASKESVNDEVKPYIADSLAKLGVNILNTGIKDVILPGDIREIMNQVLVAQKRAQANVITRREETASTRSLLNTAKLMEENEMLYKLKEMEYLEKIAESVNGMTISGGGRILEQIREIWSVAK